MIEGIGPHSRTVPDFAISSHWSEDLGLDRQAIQQEWYISVQHVVYRVDGVTQRLRRCAREQGSRVRFSLEVVFFFLIIFNYLSHYCLSYNFLIRKLLITEFNQDFRGHKTSLISPVARSCLCVPILLHRCTSFWGRFPSWPLRYCNVSTPLPIVKCCLPDLLCAFFLKLAWCHAPWYVLHLMDHASCIGAFGSAFWS